MMVAVEEPPASSQLMNLNAIFNDELFLHMKRISASNRDLHDAQHRQRFSALKYVKKLLVRKESLIRGTFHRL